MHRPSLSSATRSILLPAILLLCGACDSPEPVAVKPPPPVVFAPPPQAIGLRFRPGIEAAPGQSITAEFDIDRNGQQGPLSLALGAVPPGLTAEATDVAAADSVGKVNILVAETLGDEETALAVPVTVSLNGSTASGELRFKVLKFKPPSFRLEEGFFVQPGSSRSVKVHCDRNGFDKPIEVKLPQLPEGITVTIPPFEPGESVARATIGVADSVADGPLEVGLEALVRGRQVKASLPVEVIRNPVKVVDLPVFTLSPGESRRVTLPLSRSRYEGEFALTAVGLPEGVSMEGVVVPEGGAAADVEFCCEASAAQSVATAELIAAAEGVFSSSVPLIVRVASAADSAFSESLFSDVTDKRLLKPGSYAGRVSLASKKSLREMYGGTTESDEAVMRGLAWLAKVQQSDGSWTLQGGAEAPPGEALPDDNKTAATAFGVLPFLGEGVTHSTVPKDSPQLSRYQDVVERGLVYLATNQVMRKGSTEGFFGGSMYAHSLATIAFCEAYALSRDKKARVNAQKGVGYLLAAQDEKGGGWRYSPKEPGDLSVSGWVIIALRSAQLANVSAKTSQLRLAERFVKSCGAGPVDATESEYAYMPGKEKNPAMTAAGLLSRLYLGLSRDDPALAKGRDSILESAPAAGAERLGDVYFYYYASQVLHHLEGEDFDRWNYLIREHLVGTQVKEGPLEGSWNPPDTNHGKRGGRVYATALALLTLQMYYRHLPMFRELPDSVVGGSSADDAADRDETMSEEK
jgi:hypothetical protein